MKLLLKDFQTTAIEQFVTHLRRAARDARTGELQSVSLSSPTGSGKTVMLTAAIEALIKGDDNYPPQPEVTFLWVTDQPELNEQTRRKMVAASSVLNPTTLLVVDAAFDRPTLQAGSVHFLNTQKLGKEKYLVTPGDGRSYTIWETIANTAADRPGKLFVIIDEAHRGMSESTRARTDATTIIQKFIKGSSGELEPVPIVVGISATPDRFNRLISGTTRTARQVNIEPEHVRTSGLLKDVITLYHPEEDQASDMTMLRAAARRWQEFSRLWADYCQEQHEPLIQPVLVVQVQDKSGNQLSRTDIAGAIRAINEEAGPLDNAAFAHSFQESGRIEIGSQELRYLAPSDIDEDPDVRVVFFKTSLNTGWDCPRAEVMMSFRTAVDADLIAQLVGRMVRTPLARRIDRYELLNKVSLYLPHYDARGLAAVVDKLSAPDAETVPPVGFEKGEDILTLNRASGSVEEFDLLSHLPNYVVPRQRRASQIRRLMKLSRLLAHDEIDENAPDAATNALLDALRADYERLKDTDTFKTIIEEKGKIDVREVNWRVGMDFSDEAETIRLDIAAENLDDLFDAAGRKLAEGLHKAWWRARVAADATLREKAKLEIFAMSLEPAVIRKVETTAQQLTQGWLREHNRATEALAEARQQAYTEIRGLAAEPERAPLVYPQSIDGKKADKTWPNHLYVDERSLYPANFNRWETKVLNDELERPEVIAWLRNPDRKPWALCVPYFFEGEHRCMYPDFLIIRRVESGLLADILDPHSIDLPDAPAKAVGLAVYAEKHWQSFGRIELIIIDNEEVRALNLCDERTRNRVKVVTSREHLRHLFDPS